MPCVVLESWLEANGLLDEVEVVNLDVVGWSAAPPQVEAVPTLEADGRFIVGVEAIQRFILGRKFMIGGMEFERKQ